MEPKPNDLEVLRSSPEPHQIIRCKISNKLAFPLGYELLRTHFATSIPWSEARLWFKDYPTTFASEFAEILREQKPYRIFQVARCHQGYLSSPNNPRPAHWEFSSYPVLRELKSDARAVLVSAAFPQFLHFIKHSPTHDLYYNRCAVIFDPVAKSCQWEQLHPF